MTYTVSGGALNSTPTNHDYIMCCIHVHIQSSEFNLYWVGFNGCSQNFVYDGFVDIGVLWLGFETDTVGAGIHVAIKPCNSCFQSELLTTAIFFSKYFLCGKIVGLDLLAILAMPVNDEDAFVCCAIHVLVVIFLFSMVCCVILSPNSANYNFTSPNAHICQCCMLHCPPQPLLL